MHVMHVMDIPPEAALTTVAVRLNGNNYAYIDNHQGVSELTPALIRLKTDQGELVFKGEQMLIEVLQGYTLRLRGVIHSVEFKETIHA